MIKKILLWAFIIVDLTILIWIGSLFLKFQAASSWPHTLGHVVYSLLSVEDRPKFLAPNAAPTRWYGTDVLYQYTVDDSPYTSNRVSIQKRETRNPKPALAIMNKYRQHSDVIVYYDPNDPQQSMLEPVDKGDISMILLVGGVLSILAIFAFIFQYPEINFQGVEGHLRQGQIYQKKGKFNEALNEYNKIIELNPKLSIGYRSRGCLYLQLEQWNQAIADLDYAISIAPDDGFAYFSLANAYIGKKQWDIVLFNLQKAMERGYKVKPQILDNIHKNLYAGQA